MRAERVDTQRPRGRIPGIPNVRNACAVVHRGRLEVRKRLRGRAPVEQIDALPAHARIAGRGRTGVRPSRDRGVGPEQLLDEMASSESGGARNQGGTRHVSNQP